MPSLSALADPFVPMTDHLSITYYFDQYKFLKTLESTATSDPAFLSKIKSAFYQLKHQLDLTITTAGSLHSPAPTSTTPSIQTSTSFSICNSNSPISSSIDSFSSSLLTRQSGLVGTKEIYPEGKKNKRSRIKARGKKVSRRSLSKIRSKNLRNKIQE